jgi:hypothetical protein
MMRADGYRNDRDCTSKLSENKVSFNPPDANRRDVSAYAPSSGVRDDPEPGNAKNATTLTTNEAKTITYNLLFRVVNFTLKSFIVLFYRILDLWKFKNEREAVGPRWPW